MKSNRIKEVMNQMVEDDYVDKKVAKTYVFLSALTDAYIICGHGAKSEIISRAMRLIELDFIEKIVEGKEGLK